MRRPAPPDALRLEQPGNEERMIIQFHCPQLPRCIASADVQWAAGQQELVPWAEPEAAIVRLLDFLDAIDAMQPRTCGQDSVIRTPTTADHPIHSLPWPP